MNHIQYAKDVLDSHRLDDLKSLIKNHPHLGWTDGVSIDVHEFIPM